VPDSLIRELQDAKVVDEYIVGMRSSKALRRQLGGGQELHRHEGRELEAKIFIDRGLGRGHSVFFVPPGAQLRTLIQKSASRALGALGPSWNLQPPSAPARVEMLDQTWADDLEKSLEMLTDKFQAHMPSGMRLLGGSIEIEIGDVRAILSNGFDNHYGSTRARVSAQLQATNGVPVSMEINVRRQEDLRWQAQFESAERASLQGAAAVVNESREYDLVLLSSAYAPRAAGDYGIWSPIAYQCNAGLAAEGMARYLVGQPILSDSAKSDQLTLRSDGTRNYGLRSAPFDRDGQAVRRFSIVKEGRAAGQSVDYRQAAIRKIQPNGGVRNLVLESGKMAIDALLTPGERPLLVVQDLSELHAEKRGGLLLRVERSERRERDSAGVTQTKATRGGVLCGNLYKWLQDVRFSSERQDLNWFEGPKAIRFNKLRLQV
jgi:predicted Zn-dependent protease